MQTRKHTHTPHTAQLPRDYYTAAGSLRPAASRAEALLRRALSLDASHPLALHLHIHISEAAAPTRAGAGGGDAAWAGRALGSADALVAAAPQQGHLLHMPSHIYLRCEAKRQLQRSLRFAVLALGTSVKRPYYF